MKYHNQGSLFRVTVSEDEVADFARTWPCSSFCHGDRASFTFDDHGDLVDVRITHSHAGPVERDGGDVAALSMDALAYGLRHRPTRDDRYAHSLGHAGTQLTRLVDAKGHPIV